MIEKARSIYDVARMAGVSPATVSNALTGRKPVSAKLVKKVKAAVQALDYRTDPRASMLRSGEAKIIAVVVPDLDNAFFTSVVSAIEQCLGPALSRELNLAPRNLEILVRAQAAVAARHVRSASSRRTRSVRREVRWRWTLNALWTAA